MPTSGAPRFTVPQVDPSAARISVPNAIARPWGRRKKSPRDASQTGAGRSTAPPASAAVCGALELHPATENGALEGEPFAASHRADASCCPWICQTTSVEPVELIAPLSMRLPADPVKAAIAVVILEVPSAVKD